jgi:8-oxo-dGTP pyrophosphatase MutT (NUDIX family)
VNEFEPVSAEVQWKGSFLRAGIERFRYPDGAEVSRDKVWHDGAVGIVAIDDDSIWLTRQPREVVNARASLEIPAGKLDVPGESPLETARRELGEEIGKQAGSWEEILSFYTSPGFSDERVWLFLATDLSDAGPSAADEDERIEIVQWPLDRLDDAISETDDGKTLVALLWLKARRPQE